MSKRTQTYTSAGTAAATYTLPTEKDIYYSLKSHKTNTGNIWISRDTTVTAAADADECELVEPGEAVLLRRIADTSSILTTVTATKFTITNSQGRVR